MKQIAISVCLTLFLVLGVARAQEGRRVLLVDADPHFVNVQEQDFRLRPDSPALALGFQPIPVAKIGLYSDEYRK